MPSTDQNSQTITQCIDEEIDFECAAALNTKRC
jgi:hypothetical protein